MLVWDTEWGVAVIPKSCSKWERVEKHLARGRRAE